jgi:deoxyribose-phosphate aldolase
MITAEKLLSHIDHTGLKPTVLWGEIRNLCDEAVKYKTASACIPPNYVKRAREAFPDLNICTVIGFPLGYDTKRVKVEAAKEAVEAGAREIDMVVNISDVKNGAYTSVVGEILAVKEVCGDNILKVIIETCALTENEKIRLCAAVSCGGAEYIKTSTGFGTAGAVMEDIELFKKHIAPHVKIKAAGGIRTREDMEAFLNAGCDRIGTSNAGILF